MKQSLFRKLAYRSLSTLSLDGKILDIGGGMDASYPALIGGRHSFTTLNISAETKPDILFDVESGLLPVPDRTYDAALLINILEHVYDTKHVLRESNRILREGGTLVIVVPFLLYVHPSPHDFGRYTRQALERMLSDAGFTEVRIKEIGAGAWSAAYNLLHRFFPWPFTALFEALAVLLDRMTTAIAALLKKGYIPEYYPLGYVIVAKK